MWQLVVDLAVVIGAIVAILDYFELKPRLGKVTMPTTKGWKLAFMLTLIALNVGLSVFSIYDSYHRGPIGARDMFSPPLDLSRLEKIDCDQTQRRFWNETIEIDGKSIQNCTLVNTTLLFHGKDTAQLAHNKFIGTVVVTTDNPSIGAFAQLVEGFGMYATKQQGVAFVNNPDGFSIMREFPPDGKAHPADEMSGPIQPTQQ